MATKREEQRKAKEAEKLAAKRLAEERLRVKEFQDGIAEIQQRNNIPKDAIYACIENAMAQALERVLGEDQDIQVHLDTNNGRFTARHGDQEYDFTKMESLLEGTMTRIIAQAVKQMIIGGVRSIECDSLFEEFARKKGELVIGAVTRVDQGGTAVVALNRTEAILPRSEQIPGESQAVGDRVKAVVLEVRKNGNRIKVILSRTHPDFVRCLFEDQIPEIGDRTITIEAVAREAGHRTKLAVSSIDSKVDCVGACVGVRGSRIKTIIDELGGERIDIVRWSDDLESLIRNALQPATVDEVFMYARLGRAIVLVQEDQLSLAIGRRGQNVRLASKLVGWDIEIMTSEELDESTGRAINAFMAVPGVTESLVEQFLGQGFLSYSDLECLEPIHLAEMAGCTEEEAAEMLAIAEEMNEQQDEEGGRPTAPVDRGTIRIDRASAAKAAASALLPAVGEERPAAVSEARMTFESLFGPVEPKQEEESVSASDLFREQEAAAEETPTGEVSAEAPAEEVEAEVTHQETHEETPAAPAE